MRHHLAILPIAFSLSLLSSNSNVLAQSVFASQAQGTNGSTVKLEVSPGHGLNINFIPTGEIIRKAWIDDPSQIALSFDGDLCQWSGNQEQQCTNTGASVIHLRQIKPIKFPNLPRSANGSTLLTVITNGAQGPKLYYFQIEPASASSKPQYTALNIKPDSEDPTLIANQALISTNGSALAGSKESRNSEDHTTSFYSLQNNAETQSSTSTDLITNELQHSTTISSLSQATQLLKKELLDFTVVKQIHELESLIYNSASTDYFQDDEQNNLTDEQTAFYSIQADNNLQLISTIAPAISTPAVANLSSEKLTQVNYSQQVIKNINAAPSLVLGLLVARQKGEISPNTLEWLKAQTAHSWLRRGTTIEEAASRADMSSSTLHKLIEWGQTSL